MRTCEACSREFKATRKDKTCPYCEYDNDRRNPLPRNKAALIRMEQERQEREEEQEELEEYLDLDDE